MKLFMVARPGLIMETESAAQRFAMEKAKQLFLEINRHATMIEELVTSRLGEKGLHVVADVWRSVEIVPEMAWDQLEKLNLQTLEKVIHANEMSEPNRETITSIITLWPFPLYGLDLRTPDSKTRLKYRKKLRDRQRNWSPDI